MQRSVEIDKLAAAMAKAQAHVKHAIKDSTNPHFRSSYSSLKAIWDACRIALTENGVSVIQALYAGAGNEVGLETMLLHESGQFLSERFLMPVPKFDPQGVGSATMYSRRYALAAIVGVSSGDDDDDGESAMRDTPSNAPMPPERMKALREKIEAKTAPTPRSLLEACDNLETLMDVWSRFTPEAKALLLDVKDRMKVKLTPKKDDEDEYGI